MAATGLNWILLFEKTRQRPEITLDCIYADQYHHGTDGHNSRMIIAKFAGILDALESEVLGVAEKIEALLAEANNPAQPGER